MPVPVTQEIRKPLLEAFKDEMPHSYALGELFNIITRYIGEDPNEMSSGEKNILKEHIKQARSDLKQHGLISSPSKSTYMITNLGLEVLDDDPESIDDDYLARLRTRGTSEALAESEFAVLPDSEPEPEPESEPESESEAEPEGIDAELESAPEDTETLEEDIAVPEADSGLELQTEAEAETELLEDPEGDLDLTGGEEEINTSYTPEENQVIEEEDDKIHELEGFEDDDPSEFETNPEPEQLAQEPEDIMPTGNFDEEPSYDPEPEPELDSDSESESDFVITTSIPSREPDYAYEEEENIASSSVRSLESVLDKFNEELANEVLRKTAAIPSDKFEMLVIDLLSKMGYRAFQNARYTTEVSGDDCIHGVILENEPGLSPIYIQARKLSPVKKVSKNDIQAFVKAIADKGGKGLFATTASFSAQAVNYARSERIMLIDGSRLANLMITNNFCISVEKVFEIKSIDTESFGEYEKQ